MYVPQLDLEAVYAIFQQQDAETVLIDVRTPAEWELGTIPGSQRIVLDDLPESLDTLDKAKTYVMVCRSGARSNRASEMMLAQGFEDVSNFQGGMLTWYDKGYPVE